MNRYFDRLSSRLNKKATIKHMVTSQERDKLGQYPVVEETVAKVWAGVTPQTGSLLSGRAAETAISRTTHKVTIRYLPELMPLVRARLLMLCSRFLYP